MRTRLHPSWAVLSLPICALLALHPVTLHAQSVGPNSPTAGANNVGVGANAWTDPGNIVASDDARATTSAKGITNYVVGSGFGFTIPAPAMIQGIQLDVERSANGVNDVALLDGWSTGLTKSVSTGTNRCLIVSYAQENGNGSRDITAMTYGGRAMAQASEVVVGVAGGFNARLEIWYLLDADIALASGTAIVPTYGSYTEHEYCEAFSSAVFQHVDQFIPTSATQTSGAVAATNPHQLSAAISAPAGSMAINLVTSGNNTTPAVTDGGTNTYTINSGYTEGTDLYFANVSAAPNTGACVQTAHKALVSAGSEQPSCTFNGTVNRWAMIGLVLQRAREFDHAVRLMKGGVIGGADLASAGAWPSTDAYQTYGGATELWGQSWGIVDVQAANFGGALAARVQNGTARVDHMRITVYYYSTLPVELLFFRATPQGQRVRLDWATASESMSERFHVERSADAAQFTAIASVDAAGSSNAPINYSAMDHHPLPGTSYYRLKQIDTDGTSTASPIVSVLLDGQQLAPFPNPTTGMMSLNVTAGYEVRVLDNAMNEVMRAPLNELDPIVNLEGLPDGTYTILVHNGEGWTAARAAKMSSVR